MNDHLLRVATVMLGMAATGTPVHAVPVVLDPGLQVQPVVTGISQPTSMAFLGANDFLVLEKATGRVQRVNNGVVSTVLDLGVNRGSERGLLGIALSPDFATDRGVYLYWTESATGADSGVLAETPLLGNRVDRFTWNGGSLTFAQNIIQLRALQEDAGQAERGNHNGGVLRFGPDGMLYVAVGDVGRRGQLQNLPDGPTGVRADGDDQFGGPEPDSAHLTGVILRLNPDGSAPADNPFFAFGDSVGGEVGANIQKIYAYGIRNSFGMAFDPLSDELWMTDNGDDAFDEINRIVPGMNGGWVQIMGPLDRLAQYKAIETGEFDGTLQQLRWSPSNIADDPDEALARLFMLPGAVYVDPQFSWKYAVAPAALGFLDGDGLGLSYAGSMFVGAATPHADDGYLFRFLLDGARLGILSGDPALADLVADNSTKFDLTESESLRFGTGFGVTTDILTGPDGHLYVVSLSHGAVYRILPVEAGVVPEPATALLFLLGGAPLLTLRRHRGAGRRR
jgi:aldose sugar dehydrogenase